MAWSPGQVIVNDTGARVPEHTFNQPLPIVARIVWEQDGEEQFQTVALEWTGRDLYVPVTDARYPAVDRLGEGHLPLSEAAREAERQTAGRHLTIARGAPLSEPGAHCLALRQLSKSPVW